MWIASELPTIRPKSSRCIWSKDSEYARGTYPDSSTAMSQASSANADSLRSIARRWDGFEQNFYNFLPAMTIACLNAFLFRSGKGSDMY